MLTKILVAAAFLCLGVVAYGFLGALGAAETPGDAGVNAARNGMLLMKGGAGGVIVVCAIGLWRRFR